MLNTFRQIFGRNGAASHPAACVPPGRRIYAVGDVHGRRDLFDALLGAIEEDDAASAPAETTIVLLGDLVDRGADSAGVIARARELCGRRDTRILAGNHEEMFLDSFDNLDTFRHFLRHGGRETVLSYGVDRRRFADATMDEAQALMREAVPAEDIAFLASFEDHLAIGGYLFVHAGIDPTVPLAEQRQKDLRWIREPFLSHTGPHEHVVVHGHTIVPAVENRGNRIGIDTGAYSSGRLTAVRLEGETRRFIEAAEGKGSIAVRTLATA